MLPSRPHQGKPDNNEDDVRDHSASFCTLISSGVGIEGLSNMSQLATIEAAQATLEECFSRRMADLEAQLNNTAPAKETISKISEEFRAFRELVFSMLHLLRQQINECSQMVDIIETRHRRKAIIFMGIPEVEKEDCNKIVLDITHKQLELKGISASDINVCHRIGSQNKDHHRPILVRFSSLDTKIGVWRAKSKLKGSPISVKEFLTKTRQVVFSKGRQHFGMHACWTQDAKIIIKLPDGSRQKLTTMDDLNHLISRYPKIIKEPSAAKNIVSDTVKTKSTTTRLRKH